MGRQGFSFVCEYLGVLGFKLVQFLTKYGPIYYVGSMEPNSVSGSKVFFDRKATLVQGGSYSIGDSLGFCFHI